MARQSPSEHRSAGRVTHESKHGTLKSGPGDHAGKAKSPHQAIATAQHRPSTHTRKGTSRRGRAA